MQLTRARPASINGRRCGAPEGINDKCLRSILFCMLLYSTNYNVSLPRQIQRNHGSHNSEQASNRWSIGHVTDAEKSDNIQHRQYVRAVHYVTDRCTRLLSNCSSAQCRDVTHVRACLVLHRVPKKWLPKTNSYNSTKTYQLCLKFGHNNCRPK